MVDKNSSFTSLNKTENSDNKYIELINDKKPSPMLKRVWSELEDKTLLKLIKEYNEKRIKWTEIAKSIDKTAKQCYSRYRQINPSFKKGMWTKSEENLLSELVEKHGKKWALIAKIFKTRSGKQIRHHYLNILDINNKKKGFTPEEDLKIKDLYLKYGPKWKLISTFFIGRTGDTIKTRYYNKIKLFIEHDIFKNVFNKDCNDIKKPLFKSIFAPKPDNKIMNNINEEIPKILILNNNQKFDNSFNKNYNYGSNVIGNLIKEYNENDLTITTNDTFYNKNNEKMDKIKIQNSSFSIPLTCNDFKNNNYRDTIMESIKSLHSKDKSNSCSNSNSSNFIFYFR